MPTKTTVGSGDPNRAFIQAGGLFAQAMQRNSTLGRMSGPMPKNESQAGATIQRQTTTDMPIVKTVDLTRGKGAEVEFNFIQPVGAYPIMGSRMAEGQGIGLSSDAARVRVNQARFPVSVGDTMTGLRSPIDYERVARPVAQSLMNSYLDQALLVHMAGARGYHDNIEWRIPVDSDPRFVEVMVNPVLAPSANRHYMVDADGIKPFGTNAGAVDMQTTDVLSMNTVDSIRTVMESIALPPPAIKLPGDAASEDSPLRMLLVSPAQYHSFSVDKDFRQFQANALARARIANNHPLFLGEVGLWNGILIAKQPKPIRFYAGDTIRYCADYTSDTESTCTVPSGFGTTFAIDRAILLGGQAVAQAFGAAKPAQGGMPFFWSQKEFDHGDKEELLIGTIDGVSKIRWNVDQGDGTRNVTDHGVVVIDTAVPIIGARK